MLSVINQKKDNIEPQMGGGRERERKRERKRNFAILCTPCIVLQMVSPVWVSVSAHDEMFNGANSWKCLL